MEQQLKHRLVGVIIVVALVVIFVPMLFEKSDDKGKFNSTGIPSIPDDVLEKTIEFPKTAEDITPPKEDEKKTVESGYKIVPFSNEDPPPKPKSTGQPKPKMEGNTDKPLTPVEEDTTKETTKSGLEVKKEIQPTEAVKPTPAIVPNAENQRPKVHRQVHAKHHETEKAELPISPNTEPDADLDLGAGQGHTPLMAENPAAIKHHSHKSLQHKQDGVVIHKPVPIKKTEIANLPSHHQPKHSKAKPSPLLHEIDKNLEDEPVPAPAKPVTPHVKTKSTVRTVQKPKVSAPKKPSTVKPAESGHMAKAARPVESVHPATKVNKTEHSPAEGDAPQAKPKPAKTAPVPAKPAKPAKPADSE